MRWVGETIYSQRSEEPEGYEIVTEYTYQGEHCRVKYANRIIGYENSFEAAVRRAERHAEGR